MRTLMFLFAGFALAWGVSFAYLWMLGRRSARLELQLRRVEETLERHRAD